MPTSSTCPGQHGVTREQPRRELVLKGSGERAPHGRVGARVDVIVSARMGAERRHHRGGVGEVAWGGREPKGFEHMSIE